MRTNHPTFSTQVSDEGIALDESTSTAPPRARQWQTRDRARQLGNLNRSRPSVVATSARRFDPPQFTFDDINLATSPDHHAIVTQLPSSGGPLARRRREGGQVLTWLIVAFGAVALGGGLGAIGWSISSGRADAWNLALALTLVGQGTLIFGLVLVVARLWRNSRYATGKLQTVNAQLAQLQRTADELAAMRGGAPGFYAELARGASPQMLLANLKGQLDQLAGRVN